MCTKQRGPGDQSDECGVACAKDSLGKEITRAGGVLIVLKSTVCSATTPVEPLYLWAGRVLCVRWDAPWGPTSVTNIHCFDQNDRLLLDLMRVAVNSVRHYGFGASFLGGGL